MVDLTVDLTGGNIDSVCNGLGIEKFRDFQLEAVNTILEGKDCLVVAPTSSGKSLCYVAPSLVLNGLTLVVSPLISLMRDQMRELIEKGISASCLDSMQSPNEKAKVIEEVKLGTTKILFISPERLALPSFRSLIQSLPVALVAIDEAHCVNQWGFDFRPEYTRISTYLSDCYRGPKVALTATARLQDQKQICDVLGLLDPKTIVLAKARDNLLLKVFRSRSQSDHLNSILQSTLSTEGAGIIYGATRKQCDEVGRMLSNLQVSCGVYHAGASDMQRKSVYDDFMCGRIRVIVATKAFGMGINKRDIRFVFHASLPSSIEAYTQEIGRAGRDGLQSKCYMFFTSRDYHLQKYMIDKSFPPIDALKDLFEVSAVTLERNHVLMEAEFKKALEAKLDIKANVLDLCLDFLFREKVFKRSDLVRDSWDDQGIESMVSLGNPIPIENLIQDISTRKEERLQKLEAIYDLAKGERKPEFYIESYFS